MLAAGAEEQTCVTFQTLNRFCSGSPTSLSPSDNLISFSRPFSLLPVEPSLLALLIILLPLNSEGKKNAQMS